MQGRKSGPGPVVIKKYANRRLYNTATSAYVTLDHLAAMVKDGVEFIVHDAKTGEDITRSVLTQIIFEEESKGQALLPLRFLRQLIRFYGDSLQSFVPGYLEISMESFARNQEAMRKQMSDAFGGKAPFQEFEDLTRQNLALFERAVRMFMPFAPQMTREKDANGVEPAQDEQIADLKAQIETMRRQLEDLAGRK